MKDDVVQKVVGKLKEIFLRADSSVLFYLLEFLEECRIASRAQELRDGSALIVVCEVMSYSAHGRYPPSSVY